MRQRANIIRTLIYSPKVMLMDEPFGPLDAQTRVILQDQLLNIWSQTGVTIIFITHDLHEAIGLGDRVVLLSSRPGRIIRVDKVSMTRPRDVFRMHDSDDVPHALRCDLGRARTPSSGTKVDRPLMKPEIDEQEVYQSQADRRGRQQYRRRVTIGQITLVVVVIAAWHFGSGTAVRSVFRWQSHRRCEGLFGDLRDPRFWNDLRVTGTEMTLGYLLGGVSGIACGILFARWRLAADIFDPFFTGLNSLPRIALAPLLGDLVRHRHGLQGRAGGDVGILSDLLHDVVGNS